MQKSVDKVPNRCYNTSCSEHGAHALVAQLDRVTDYESVGRGFESLPSHQERPEHNVFWSFFFCAWKGLEQHGRAAGETNNSPVGCCLVRGDHRLGMSPVSLGPFWSFFFCAWKGLEQHGRAAGEANNSPVGCCLVRGDHRLGMSAVEPELCSGLSFFVRGRDSNSTAEPQARQTTARWAVV